MKNLELEAKIRALEEKAEQKANYQVYPLIFSQLIMEEKIKLI
jgi:hypothetical protein